MEIFLAAEHAYHLVPQLSLEVARDRIEQKKVNLVVGTVGAIFSRPKPEEIQLAAVENRLEPFWLVAAFSRTVYDRARSYTVTTGGPEVTGVNILGQEVVLAPQAKGAPTFTLVGTEHCVNELRVQQTFDGMSGAKTDLLKYAQSSKTEIADVNTFAPPGVLVVPPQVRATAVVRQVTAEVVQPVQNAQVVSEERVDIETIDLNFRPVYAFEYEWAGKNKRMVIEMDAVTGEMRSGGKKWSDQIKGVVTRDFLFDVTADAVGMIIPGGSIAVKLVRAVVDRGK